MIATTCYSTLSEEQQQVFKLAPDGVRKVVLATNIAETSLTIDGIVYVIDCGISKQSTWNPRVGGYILEGQYISRAAARQRSGRAGRTRPGEAHRLFGVRHWNERMVDSTMPEILRSDLVPTMLKLMTMGYTSTKDIWELEFVDQPDPEQLSCAFLHLHWM